MFTYALFMSVFYTITMYALILWVTVAKTDISSFRSSTYTLVPEGGGKEPLQDILSKYQNWGGAVFPVLQINGVFPFSTILDKEDVSVHLDKT